MFKKRSHVQTATDRLRVRLRVILCLLKVAKM